MSTATVEQPLTYEEERGKPMPSQNHGAVQFKLCVEFGRHPGFRFYSELSLDLDGQTFVPDLSVFPPKSLDFRRDVVRVTETPLTVVEIFSPTQGQQEVLDKVDIYFRHGVKSCWIVSPAFRTITVLTPDGAAQVYQTGTVTDPATGLTADLARVFS